MAISEEVYAEMQTRADRSARERQEYVNALATLFIAGKLSATLLGDRLTKWELVEVLQQVQQEEAGA